jgi:puromycin-sensitive aminopeptidase
MTTTDYRLPRTFIPKHYTVSLCASPRRQTFNGTVTLDGKLIAECDSIELHARGLQLKDVTVHDAQGRHKARVRRHKDRETVELCVARPLRGQVLVTLAFAGKLNPGMHGLYLAKDGPERAIVSQCEATDARAIFPCLDEPDRKATLTWRVQAPAGLQVITNGALLKSRKVRGKDETVHTFAPTPVISTYLAAVVIGDLSCSPTLRVQGIDCRAFAGRGKADQTEFAQAVTAFVLPYYSKYFGQKYAYGKLDQVAVPGFDAGAMENVGAIFYRQSLLLMRQQGVSWNAQKRIAEVIAHEIAHQWFGNLVTMQWWDDLWLNEAFATWIAYKVCDLWQPQWRMWDDFLASKQDALAADALVHTHPVYTEVKSPAQATELFDVITYEKGCAILRMVENYLGEKTFRSGIRSYMKAFKNRNACGADLWEKLSAAAPEPVDKLMQGWINKPGFPLVTCSVKQRGGRTTLHLSQRRFFAHATAMQEPAQAAQGLWTIPLIIQYDLGNGPAEHRCMLSEHEQSVALPESGRAAWIYPNAHSAGFYRVMLDDASLQALLKKGLMSLSPGARMALLEDQWSLVLCGLSNVEQFFDVLAAYRAERDHAVVRAMVARLHALYQDLVQKDDLPALRKFTCWLLQPQLDELDFLPEPNEAAPRAVRRAAVLGALGEIGRHPEVLHEAVAMMEMEQQDPYKVEANVAGTAIALSALVGDGARLKRFVQTYLRRKKEGSAPQLQARYLGALTLFEAKPAVTAILKMCLDETIAQEQLRSVLVPLLSRRATQKQTWIFLQKNWQAIGPRIGGMGMARLVEATGALPQSARASIVSFFKKNPVPEAVRAIQKALEAMDLRTELVARESARAAQWLSQHSAVNG